MSQWLKQNSGEGVKNREPQEQNVPASPHIPFLFLVPSWLSTTTRNPLNVPVPWKHLSPQAQTAVIMIMVLFFHCVQ
jgi:hypothetical protein